MAVFPKQVVCFNVPAQVAQEIRGLPGPGARVAALIAYFERQGGKRSALDPSESPLDEHNGTTVDLDTSNEFGVMAEAQGAPVSGEAWPEEQSLKPDGQETVNGDMIDGLETPASQATHLTSLSGDLTAITAREQEHQAGSELSITTPDASHEQSTSPSQTMLGGAWLLPVRVVQHVVELVLRDLLGGKGTSRVVQELGEVLKAPTADTADARKEHADGVTEAFAPFVTAAADHIHHHLRTNGSRNKHLGLDNSDLVLTLGNEDRQVVLVFAQKLANELHHRIKVQLRPEDRLVICPDSPGTS
ncbi:hypothetical protein [Actinacidiphila glaucinigra]|uniref:hypothetical protein n=1 Tax=Actinacidiphila glaucinigra TaxID=235986 RepID=UPI003D93129F